MRIRFGNWFLSAVVAASVLVGATNAAMAHHSFSAFNTQAERTVTGIVKQVDWTNPHIWIWVDVPNGQGGTDRYGFEGMSPNYLERRNWTRTTLKAGDQITITYNPLRDGSNGGMFRTGKLSDGKVLTSAGGQ
jgi:hypothetical protein